MIQSVMIDSREPQWVQMLRFGNAPIIVTQLPAGDFWLATGDGTVLVVERKTPGDFLSTLASDRLFAQMAACHAASVWSYLLITGELLRTTDGKVLTDRVTGWDWNAVQGALLTVQELGVHVTYCNGDNDLVPALTRLANRSREAVPVGAPRQSRVLSESEQIIASLPGIGMERLDAVATWAGPLSKYGWAALIGLTDPKCKDIPGVGSGIQQKIRRAFGLPDDLCFDVVSNGQNGNENGNEKDNSNGHK